MNFLSSFLSRRVRAKEIDVSWGKAQVPVRVPEPIYMLGVDEEGEKYGIFKGDRVHIAIFGFTGVGKSRLLLSLILQHVRRGEGFLLIDPHGDLARLVLTHIPPELRDRVVYIDPMTAFRHSRVVQVNFLEYKGGLDRELVARTFTDGLMKIYGRFWGPRLDMILLNALYALLEAGSARLTDLYYIIADEEFRDNILLKVTDPKVRTFWREEFKRMPKDASVAVLTKIYRLVQERILVPMFECDRSSIDFRRIMDEGKMVVVNLSEGALTSDVANFLGSMILARIYLAGMSREDASEEQRKPYFVYVDEAHRFTSSSLKDMLEALRKYRVYITLASQHLDQYVEGVREAIPNLCETIICFSVGEATARRLAEFYKPALTHEHLVRLPRHWFAVSAMVKGRRECIALKCIDHGGGIYNPEETIEASLKIYGRRVETAHLTKKAEELPSALLEVPYMSPVEWLVLTRLYYKGGEQHMLEEKQLFQMLKELGITILEGKEALNTLSYRNYVAMKRRNIEIRKQLPNNPHVVLRRRETIHLYELTKHGLGLLEQVPKGRRGGLPDHIQMIGEVFHQLAEQGYFCLVDTAEDVGKKRPDILVYPPERLYDKQGRFRGFHPKNWDTPHRFAVEVETDPAKHPQRVVSNWEKCRDLGLPVLFISDSLEKAKSIYGLLVNTTANIVRSLPEGKLGGTIAIGMVAEGIKLFIPEDGKTEEAQLTAPSTKSMGETVLEEEARKIFGPLPPLGVKVRLPLEAVQKFGVELGKVEWKNPEHNTIGLKIPMPAGSVTWEVPAEKLVKTEEGWRVRLETGAKKEKLLEALKLEEGKMIKIPVNVLEEFGVKISGLQNEIEGKILAASKSEIQVEIKHEKLSACIWIPRERIVQKRDGSWAVMPSETERKTSIEIIRKPEKFETETPPKLEAKTVKKTEEIEFGKVDETRQKIETESHVKVKLHESENLLETRMKHTFRGQPDRTWIVREKEEEKAKFESMKERIRRLLKEGWRLRVKQVKGKPYLTAYKRVEGRKKEISLGPHTEKTKEILRSLLETSD
jgi:hypothetical protein